MESYRIEWIDIAKGIGILLVILGHTIQYNIVSPIYAFHMPLFFFLSGLLLKQKYLGSFSDFSKKKTAQLLKPWLVISAISFIVCLAIPEWRANFSIYNFVRDFYTSNTNVIQNSSLWYLPCFFFASLIFYCFTRLCDYTRFHKLIFIVFSFTLLFLPFILKYLPLPFGRIPFKIDTALVAVVFICISSYYREQIINFVENRTGILVCVALLFVCILSTIANDPVNINSLEFGKFRVLFYPIAFVGIFTVIFFSSLLSKKGPQIIVNILSYFGKNSLIIFGFQSLYIRLYLYTCNQFWSLDMELYGENPLIHQVLSFLIIAFVLSPITVELFHFIKKRKF